MTYNSSFQDRAAQAAQARQKALEQYRAKPPVDEKVAAERRAAGLERDAARAENAATNKAERRAEAATAAAGAPAQAAAPAPPTQGRRKAPRHSPHAAPETLQ